MLDEQPVAAISTYLSRPGKVIGEPHRLAANAGQSFQGSKLDGIGFLITRQEAEALIDRALHNRSVLSPYLNGEDLNSRPDQSPSRWVIDLDLGHGFDETHQGLRFTISEAARQEVLDRLLALNHERYAEEVRQGLHEKGAKKKAKRQPKVERAPARSRATQPDLDLDFQLTPQQAARR